MFAIAIHAAHPRAASNSHILSEADQRLRGSTHFANHADCLRMHLQDGRLIVSGRVPSFYLKSVLQQLLAGVEGVSSVENRVEVVSSEGLSSVGATAAKA